MGNAGPIHKVSRPTSAYMRKQQVMKLAMVGAGYTGREADQPRRSMAAWKKSGKLLRRRQRLIDGFQARGVSREFAERIFEQIKGFGEYGFPWSHAATPATDRGPARGRGPQAGGGRSRCRASRPATTRPTT